jgi:hypothetical protein
VITKRSIRSPLGGASLVIDRKNWSNTTSSLGHEQNMLERRAKPTMRRMFKT